MKYDSFMYNSLVDILATPDVDDTQNLDQLDTLYFSIVTN